MSDKLYGLFFDYSFHRFGCNLTFLIILKRLEEIAQILKNAANMFIITLSTALFYYYKVIK